MLQSDTNSCEPAALELSIVMPCLNEARTVGTCVRKALDYLDQHHVKGEVIIAHNGSTDGSQAGQALVAAGLSAGRTGPRYWRETACEVDLYDVKADALLAAMGASADNIQVTADPPASYHPGRAGASVVDRELPADTLLRAARGVDRKLVTEIRLFDVYEGTGLAEGKKSLAITVVLQPQGRTLTDAEIEGFSKRLIAQVEKATADRLRG
jgi:phenylalanyl-tRNA synthetase beta subunit